MGINLVSSCRMLFDLLEKNIIFLCKSLEIINKGEYGYFFEVGNAEDCAIQIEKIMSSDNVQLVNSAYKRVCQIYNIETTAKRYIEEYKKII